MTGLRLPGWRWRDAKRAHAAGLAALAAGDWERAEMLFRFTVSLAPTQAPAWLNLGNALGHQGAHRSALACYQEAHRLDPMSPQPRVNAGYAHLVLGEWRDGWVGYEQRWHLPTFRDRNGLPGEDARKRWDGRAFEGESLLIFAEQGVGDVIQMLRYTPHLVATGMRVMWRVRAGLLRLVRRNVPSSVEVVLDTDPRLPEHHWHAPAMSLPYLCGTETPEQVPARDGYLTADPHPDVSALPGTTIGVVWAGSPAHSADARRSMPITELAPLFALEGVTVVSLQVGDREHEGTQYGLRTFPTFDYWDTARLITSLGAVVGVDTSVVHLAGALGVPTFVMLPTNADWRWLLGRERSCWYNSVRLVRQRHSGEWGDVVARVRAMIAARVTQYSTRRTA